jgi:Na+-driven multidrug efflux pump
VIRWRLQLRFSLRQWWQLNWPPLKPVFQVGLPGALEAVCYRGCVLITVMIVAREGAHALATQSYTMQIMNLGILLSASIAFACEILLGHLIGAGAFREGFYLVRKTLLIALILSMAFALSVAISAPYWLPLLTQDRSIVQLASRLLWITVLLEVGRTVNIVLVNALRAAGDAPFTLPPAFMSMALCMALGAWYWGVVCGYGIVGVWFAYAADECCRAVISAWRWFTLGWLPKARLARQRVRLA